MSNGTKGLRTGQLPTSRAETDPFILFVFTALETDRSTEGDLMTPRANLIHEDVVIVVSSIYLGNCLLGQKGQPVTLRALIISYVLQLLRTSLCHILT